MDSNLTEHSELESTLHDRQRREERQIEKITLQEARRYGMKERQGKTGRIMYYYAGHVFVYDERRNKAITSYKFDRLSDLYKTKTTRNDVSNDHDKTTEQKSKNRKKQKQKPIKSGTRFTKPIMMERSKDHMDPGIVVAHESTTEYIQSQPALWTSHTVIVVDMSGSMREDDVNGARCRADGVWTTLARNFCRAQLEDQSSCLYDVVSVIAMRKTAKVVIRCEPLTWVLYNKLVDFREWDNMKPEGHGFYKPALQKANELLNLNNHGSCALSLMFFSDGKPSDFYKEGEDFLWKHYNQVEKDLAETCGVLASRFGRRLSITCVGMADTGETFSALRLMTKEAKQFGALASFHQPSLNTDSLSQIISSSVASSLSSKIELTSLKNAGTTSSRSVRMDVERERQNVPDTKKPKQDEWRIFKDSNSDQRVVRVWTWSDTQHDFATVIDPRCQKCTRPVANSNYEIQVEGGVKCSKCQACFFCQRCVAIGVLRNHMAGEECQEYLSDRRQGFLVGKQVCPLSFNVAWKKKAFGEGAERLAYKFRFTNPYGSKFLGPVMVAKESRFVEDMNESTENYLRSKKHSYHKTFMRTQSIASQFAARFNHRLEKCVPIELLDHVPKIEFVKPLIFELEDKEAEKTYNVLVEPMIDGNYRKFSDNHGDLAPDFKRDFGTENKGVDIISAALLLGRKVPNTGDNSSSSCLGNASEANQQQKTNEDLEIIEEGDEDDEDDEEEDEDDDSSEENNRTDEAKNEDTDFDVKSIPDTDFLQAFSHFSYAQSGGRLMVVDLQGTLRAGTELLPRKIFLLTDPAIHQRYRRRDQNQGKRQFGRTDLGVRGMKAFFASHECNDVCRLLRLRDRPRTNVKTDDESMDTKS